MLFPKHRARSKAGALPSVVPKQNILKKREEKEKRRRTALCKEIIVENSHNLEDGIINSQLQRL